MLLKKCPNKSCNSYTFKDKCPKCNSETKPAGLKFRERFVKERNS
ncbi:ribosome biogenesis protein [Candidatus Pacearchaeota archaeon CG10_big_fil_rev_8_21_14_0_10_31_9]|nr:MAG: ribosome biogenesis protein [Candidatus Pacearchaeota archaeon CG10_big_fil_rev_8_21_14_0_10_31_9]PIZ82517.1 MAG: ribosome biogenesis protein [Candidatus Pacearchaeota archaeon CG_4_10_14_0_2_um_filter_05_32_18]